MTHIAIQFVVVVEDGTTAASKARAAPAFITTRNVVSW